MVALIIAIALASATGEEDPWEKVKPLHVTVVAVQATRETGLAEMRNPLDKPDPGRTSAFPQPSRTSSRRKKVFDSSLKTYREVLEDLDYDRFRRVCRTSVPIRLGEEQKLTLTKDYTLLLKPLTKDDQGRMRLSIRIEDRVRKGLKTTTRCALASTSAIAPEKPLRLGGLRLTDGQLIVLISVEGDKRISPPKRPNGADRLTIR